MSSKSVGTNPASVALPMKPHYSNSIRTESGPLLFIAGQVALDADGKLVHRIGFSLASKPKEFSDLLNAFTVEI